MRRGTKNALLGFLAGAAAGTLTGILVAPAKGSKTRKRISGKVKKVSKDVTGTLGERVSKLKDQVNEVIDDMKGKAEKTSRKFKDKVNEKANDVAAKTASASK
jgi:gas vesicle protein